MKTSSFFIFLYFLILTTGCDKPNPTPELLDKVYLELNRELSNVQKTKEAKDKEFEELVATMDTLEPRSREKKSAWENYFRLKKEIAKLDQNILYLQLKVHSRMTQDRKEYMEARRNKTDWPHPESFEQFQLQRKLANAPKIWRRGIPEKKAADKKEKDKKAAKAEGPGEN